MFRTLTTTKTDSLEQSCTLNSTTTRGQVPGGQVAATLLNANGHLQIQEIDNAPGSTKL